MCVRVRATPGLKCKCHQDFSLLICVLQVVTERRYICFSVICACFVFFCFFVFFFPLMLLCLRGSTRPGFRAKCHVVFLVSRVRIIVFYEDGQALWALTD